MVAGLTAFLAIGLTFLAIGLTTFLEAEFCLIFLAILTTFLTIDFATFFGADFATFLGADLTAFFGADLTAFFKGFETGLAFFSFFLVLIFLAII